MQQLLLVSNAAAGTNEEQAVIEAVDVLMGHYDVKHVETSEPEELRETLAMAAECPVVVAGGDGSLHAVVNALHSLGLLTKTQLGLIPLGTGNDFARGVGIPLDPEEAAHVVTDGHEVPVDLIVDDRDRVVINTVHLGVGADASRKAEKWKPRFGKLKLGKLGYVVGALDAGVSPEFIEVKVTVDGAELAPHGHIAQVAIGNGSHVGGGTELIPGADPSSGHLVVILSRVAGHVARTLYLLRLRTGKHHLMREVIRVNGQEVQVEGDTFYLSADGEIAGPYARMGWRLLPGALRMFLPR